MGRLTHETSITHFSHPHPLHLTSSSDGQHQLVPISCAACTLPCSSWTYTCKPCRFHLHVDPCSTLPPLINHPSHPPHTLSLLPYPPYPEGRFECDACCRPGTGFSYHCPHCSLDLHTACASVPLSIRHHAHPYHPLTLAFHPPYDNKGFSCDVCGSLGGNHWLYRCALCEFDVHLGCGVARAGSVTVGRSVSLPQAGAMAMTPVGMSRMGSTGGLMRQVVGGLLDGATQQIGSNLASGFMGGGGGGGDAGGGSVLDIGSSILGSVLGNQDS